MDKQLQTQRMYSCWQKLYLEKLDNKQYSPNKDGGISQQNQLHEELLYPKFERFLCYQCNININNPFLINHDNAIHILTKEGDNIWGDNVREELNEFKNDVEDIILPANNQGQQV